ncbi:MAG TPA: hypothetical protein VGJ19_23385 [Streptosporangiaceae bacterium]
MSEMDMEKPADDAQEQERDLVETDVDEEDVEDTTPHRDGLPFDANEADAAEQDISVEDDEEDYR